MKPSDLVWEPSAVARSLGAKTGDPTAAEFIEAALVFSGLSPEEITPYRVKLDRLAADVTEFVTGKPRTALLAEELLLYLHQHILKKYVATETALTSLIDKGFFNCVSSSVVYALVAETAGYAYAGVRTKDHAFIKIAVDGVWYDVETTNQFGFDPGKKKEFGDEFGRVTGFVYTPPSNYRDREDIGPKELLSLILNNGIVDNLEKKNFASVIKAGVELFELLKDADSLKMLTGILSEVAKYALQKRLYDPGLATLDEAVVRYGEFSRIADLRSTFLAEWARTLIQMAAFTDAEQVLKSNYANGKLPADNYRSLMLYRYYKEIELVAKKRPPGTLEALALVSTAKAEFGTNPELEELERVHSHNLILELIDAGDIEKGFQTLEQFSAAKRLSSAEYLGLFVYATQKKAEGPVKKGDYLSALSIIEEGMLKIGQDKRLLANAAIFAENHAIDLFKSSGYEMAKLYIEGSQGKKYLSKDTEKSLLRYYYQVKADDVQKTLGERQAFAVLEEGIKKLGQDRELLRRFEVSVHNYVLPFFNQKDYDGAEEIVYYGLSVYSQSSLLKADLETIRRAR